MISHFIYPYDACEKVSALLDRIARLTGYSIAVSPRAPFAITAIVKTRYTHFYDSKVSRPLPKCTVGHLYIRPIFVVSKLQWASVADPSHQCIHYFAFFRFERYCIDVTAQPQKGRSFMVPFDLVSLTSIAPPFLFRASTRRCLGHGARPSNESF